MKERNESIPIISESLKQSMESFAKIAETAKPVLEQPGLLQNLSDSMKLSLPKIDFNYPEMVSAIKPMTTPHKA